MRKRILLQGLAVVLVLSLGTWMVGCDDDDNPIGGTSYAGTFADSGGGSGSLSFDLPAPTSMAMESTAVLGGSGVAITGQLRVGAGTIILSGTFDEGSNIVTLTGGGYTFSGARQGNGTFVGSCGTPTGTGSWVALPASSFQVVVFCGTYTCSVPIFCNPIDQEETFNLVVSGGSAVATIVLLDGTPAVASGIVTGSAVDVEVGSFQASGQLAGGAASGTWSDTTGEGGTWSASTAACQAR